MTYLRAIDSPQRMQWETSSQYSQAWNCGPTCVAKIDQFYGDTWHGVEANRPLIRGMGPYNVTGVGTVYGAPPQTPTTAWQQRDMLIRRGIPASVRQLSSTVELHGLVDTGRRPVIIGMLMSQVPSWYRDHPFQGMHAVVVMGGEIRDGVRGFWIMDPNFSTTRPDPDRGKKWYPDWVVQNAFINTTLRYAVVPTNAKVVAAPKGRAHVKGPGINIRSTASTASSSNIYARSNADGYTYRLSDGRRLWSNSSPYLLLGYLTVSGVVWCKLQTGSGLRLFCWKSLMIIDVAP